MKIIPAVSIVALVLVVTAVEWCLGMSLCDGAFVYPLDDTYIHIALAKQLAVDGTWGFEPGVYAFASSSPLWTVLLALTFRCVGCHEWLPLVFSNAFAALALWIVLEGWRRCGLTVFAQVLCGIILSFVVPFITLANLGMEHALHAVCIAWLISSALRFVGGEKPCPLVALCVSAALATATRYETLFVVAALTILLLGDRRWRAAVAVALSSAAPVLIYGCFSLAHGGGFLPMSMTLKTGPAGAALVNGVSGLMSNISADTIHCYLMLVLMLGCATLTSRAKGFRQIALVLAFAIVGHLVFARLGWLYRYESYLVLAVFMLLPLFKIGAAAEQETPTDGLLRLAPLGLVAITIFPFLARGFAANVDTVLAQREIYEQQVQMGRIFASLPDDQKGPVAVNDLGYVVLHAGVHVLDLWGLGSDDVAKIKIAHQMTAGRYAELLKKHDIRYAAFYINWYSPTQLSPELKPVAVLSTNARVICGGRNVLLCVTRENDITGFRNHLNQFKARLPAGSRLQFLDETGNFIN